MTRSSTGPQALAAVACAQIAAQQIAVEVTALERAGAFVATVLAAARPAAANLPFPSEAADAVGALSRAAALR